MKKGINGCFRILKSYKEIDEIPAEMLKSSFSGKMDLILGQLDIICTFFIRLQNAKNIH